MKNVENAMMALGMAVRDLRKDMIAHALEYDDKLFVYKDALSPLVFTLFDDPGSDSKRAEILDVLAKKAAILALLKKFKVSIVWRTCVRGHAKLFGRVAKHLAVTGDYIITSLGNLTSLRKNKCGRVTHT
jgi:hypothetical protein